MASHLNVLKLPGRISDVCHALDILMALSREIKPHLKEQLKWWRVAFKQSVVDALPSSQ